MPTENRSSNTDPRDVFIRLNPLGLGEAELRKDSTGFEDQRTHSDYLLFLAGYRESHPEPLQHTEQNQGGPASCIDAEPFFGLLEALRGKIGYAIQFPVNCDAFKDGISKVWETIESLEKCIAIAAKQIHADPGEVERLREDLAKYIARANDFASKMQGARSQVGVLEGELAECAVMSAMVIEREWAEHVGTGDVSSKVEAAFTQLHNDLHEAGEKLAERDALLREIEKRHWSGVDFDLPHDLVVRIKALSASAEQEARS